MKPEGLRAWLEIDLGALVRNARAVAARADVPLLPMVKADAYGLGAVAVTRALEAVAPWGFGVATIDEGVTLRQAGVTRPVIVFNPLLIDEIGAAHAARLSPTLSDAPTIAAWANATGNAPWHLAIDTGMSRTGIRWTAVPDLAPLVRERPPAGACTHFFSAEADDGSLALQLTRFDAALDTLPARPQLVHAENSAAVERLTGPSRWDLVRPGVFLYGVSSLGQGAPGARADVAPPGQTRQESIGADGPLHVEPVVALRARVVDLRRIEPGDTVSYGAIYRARASRRIATVAAGYGDGYCRAFSNIGVALVGGQRVPVVGIVTMDMTMLNVTDVDCVIGDVATLLGVDSLDLKKGAQSGTAPARRPPAIDLIEAARAAGVFTYELLTGLRLRLPRVYLDPPLG